MSIAGGVAFAHKPHQLPPPPTLEAAYIRERVELLADKRAPKGQLEQLKKSNEEWDA